MSQAAGTSLSLVPPHGLDQIIQTFGDIFSYMREDHTLDARWQADFLTAIELPFPLTLSWDHARSVQRITCNKKLGEIFVDTFANIHSAGLHSKIASFGGCFSFRAQRTGSKLSAHAWGIAIDLNPESNAQGTAGNIDSGLISIFKQAGFSWGGDWQGRVRDPMHFQFCTGY